MIAFPSRFKEVKPSATLKYAALAKREGVINLTIGRPDWDSPEVVKNAAKKALDEGKVHYTPSLGIPELRERIAEKLRVENGISGLTGKNVWVSIGAKQVLYEIIMVLVGEGDKVALPDPSWVSYEAMVKLAGGRVEWLPLKAENGFIPDEEFLSALENSKAKVVIINSPHNPTGAVYPPKLQQEIVDICERKDMWIISDECYESFIYEGEAYSLGSIYEKTITVNAFSKSFSMTGWRIGYGATKSVEIMEKIQVIQSQSVSCPVSFVQYAALAAFTSPALEYTKTMVEEYRKRRDYVMNRLKKFNCICITPGGAFYVFPKFPGMDDLKLADRLLEVGVGVVPGSPFGSRGKSCIRLSYGSADVEKLKEAFDRMESVEGILS